MILGPNIGYLIQCFTMKRERNAEGFSPFICLILLIANIFRIFWW
jgi:solute carrier family 66, member 2